LLFALIQCAPILPDLAQGINRQFLPSFWRCSPTAGSLADGGKGSKPNRRLEFQLRAWFVGPRRFVLVLSAARAMEHGLSPFGRANYENVLLAVPTMHHVNDRARIFHSHGARHGASVSG
jgi:hypothetical protein